jgi:16S rRNA (guanine527-N7)-methyltransferase
MPGNPARQALLEGLEELRLEPPPDRIEALLQLAAGVDAWGQRMNLSGHRSAESVVRRLVLEALALLQVAPRFDTLADLGSGAGFPGLPIAIVRSDVQVTLIEARERRHHFQRAMCRELGLANAEPVRGRAEELEPRAHAAVVAQALAAPALALRWMQHWAAPGGWLLLPGTERSTAPEPAPGLTLEERRSYRAPGGAPSRVLWILRRS